MASRLDFFFRQRVSERELDLAFDQLEQADHDLASDIGLFGIVSGADPAPHTPVPDLSIDLTAPLRAYDRLGQRIAFGTGQRVDLSVDHSGIPTDVRSASNERWLAVFVRFDRLLSDPRTDGHSARVFFRRDEHFQLVVRQAPEGPVGAAPRVPLEDAELLVCDVRRRAGSTQILAEDLDTSRRQAFVIARADSVGVMAALWRVLSRGTTTTQDALDEVDRVLAEHAAGAELRHDSTQIAHAPRAPLSSARNVAEAFEELAARLARRDAASGASLVGAEPLAGAPFAVSAGSVQFQLAQLLANANGHVGARSGAHAASAISLLESGGAFANTNVMAILLELALAVSGDHHRANEPNAGMHKVIRQPVLGSGRVLLFDAQGNGERAARVRIYLDGESLWITMNARWSGSRWERDHTDASGGMRLSRYGFELLCDMTSPPAWTEWERRWLLPMRDDVNAGFQSDGPVRDTGHFAMAGTNTGATRQAIRVGASANFRTRLAAVPSSITFTPTSSSGFTTPPVVYRASRDGFTCFNNLTVDAGSHVWWDGTFVAVA